MESDAAVLTVSPVPPTVQAPTILAQPAFVYLTEGQSSALVVATTGTAPLRFQWYRAELTALNDYTPIAGATSPMLSFNPVQLGDNAIYRVEVSNAAGTVRSTGIWGSVTANADRVVPSVTQQPAPLVVLPGDTAVFAVGYSGGGRTLAFQWLKNGTAIAGATQAFLQIDNAQAEDAASYSVRISTSAGSVTSAPALLTVVGAPAITAQPQAVTGTEGASVRFAVAAGGSALLYQWTRNHVAIVGATAAEYTTPALALADDGALYGVVVYNGAGIAFSEQALLTVRPAPVASPEDKIAAGLNHTCAIDRSDALYCWGNEPAASWATAGVSIAMCRHASAFWAP
ncbi:hypothetical protein FSC37_16160 [Piscinibacter aquaticus]|uniref:Ig-like domain-containing protein n=1 Tax=Piscinibacter aquaticus TaxID=392597 RepID=A0A5C6U1Y8_9BURK|nr:hypothetical protein FSC37_16160 [Piscinibacter aquaticus]